jgi:2,4-dienoyl-CoA reductase-like NADH-dependent reductase (Old Yellow Enzyme family)
LFPSSGIQFPAVGGIFTRGPGLTFTEATAVLHEGRVTGGDLGVRSDDHIAPLAKIVELVHSQYQKFGIQLSHSGCKESIVSPWASLIGRSARDTPKDAAVRAIAAGFNIIEIHSAHGFLLTSLMSPWACMGDCR